MRGAAEVGSIIRRLKPLLLALPGFERLCLRLTRRHVRALMYHRFTDDPAAYPRRMPVAEFRRQLEHLARCCEVVAPDRQAALEDGGARPADRPLAVITVDDGYSDFHTHAFPLLQELGLPGVLFVTTGFVQGTCWMWWDRIRWALDHTARRRFEFPFRGTTLSGDCSSEHGRAAIWQTLVPALRFVQDQEKEQVVAAVAAYLEVEIPLNAPPRYAAVTRDQLAAMAAAGLHVGAHTRTHPILSRISEAEAREEIGGSRTDLADWLGRAPDWFAYTQGGPADYTPETVALVEESGYRDCYVAYLDLHREGRRFARHRYHAAADWDNFRWIVCGADYLVLRLRRRFGLQADGVGAVYWNGYELAGGTMARGRARTDHASRSEFPC